MRYVDSRLLSDRRVPLASRTMLSVSMLRGVICAAILCWNLIIGACTSVAAQPPMVGGSAPPLGWRAANTDVSQSMNRAIFVPDLGGFVTVGDGGTILTSQNASTWNSAQVPIAANLYGVAAGDGHFVAVGADGTVLFSPDGQHWSQSTSGTSAWLYAVAFTGRQFVAVGQNSRILTSADGASWTTVPDVPPGGDLLDVV